MTPRSPTFRRTLQILTIATVLLFAAPRLHAQDCDEALTEMEAALTEVEAVNADITKQRDRCFVVAEKKRTERDECRGQLKELRKAHQAMQVRVVDYDRVMADNERLRKRNWRYFAAGAVTIPLLTGVALLTFLAIRPASGR